MGRQTTPTRARRRILGPQSRPVVEADRLGFDATPVAQHEVNPSGDHYDQLEAWTASAALAAVTEKIEIITAIKPALYHPVVLAKQALQIEEIGGGRFGVKVVNAWFRPEIARAGLPFLEHDERYSYGREWLTVVDSLIRGRRTTFHGKYFHVDDYQLRPARFGLAAFVIARDTDQEAADELAYAFELAGRDTAETHSVLSNADPKAQMFKTFAAHPHVGTNGGTAAGLVGSYDTVAERVIPRVRRLEQRAACGERSDRGWVNDLPQDGPSVPARHGDAGSPAVAVSARRAQPPPG
ncbi:LLM class flavin-dependent oxidoreductase [Mycolicibacterium sp. Y3]